ncbi:MAG: hypothetical protein KDA25_04450 [Phycisphaerales bacterium]|nr:hypothetical protein [Phycisphaerales bacterium]
MFVIGRRRVAAVAEGLALTTHDVHMARRRVTRRLRDMVARLDGADADEP